MDRFKSIGVLLAETQQDQPILQRALALAAANGAAVSVYVTLDPGDGEADREAGLRTRVEEMKERRLHDAATGFADTDVPLTSTLLVGKPFLRVIQKVIANRHDLLMAPAEVNPAPSSLFLGSTPMHLLRKCPCAVWIFRPHPERRFHRILAAVNLSGPGAEERKLNRKVMEMSISLAASEDCDLDVVYCWRRFGESMLAREGAIPEQTSAQQDEEDARVQEDQLYKFLLGFPIDKERTHRHVLKGEAGERIPRLVAEQNIDMTVMGTVARSGIPGLLMGNAAEKILNHVPCSVLAVKPDGFVSPVRPESG